MEEVVKALAQAFLPNRIVSKKMMLLLAISQVAIAFLIWLNSPFAVLPQPGEVVVSFGRLWMAQGLSREIWTSFTLNMEALGLSSLISLVLAYLTVLPVFQPVVLGISKGRFLGLVGLTFVFTVIFGGGHSLKLALLVFGMTVFLVTSLAAEVEGIARDDFDYARTLRMNEWHLVWEVVVRGTLDRAIEMIRQNAAIGWVMLTMVEGIVRSEGGVGALLLAQERHFLLSDIFAVQLTILTIGLVQDYGIGVVKRILCPYAFLTLERR